MLFHTLLAQETEMQARKCPMKACDLEGSSEGDPSLRAGASIGEEEQWEVGTTKRVLGHPPRGSGFPDSGLDCAVGPWGKCPESSASALLLCM